MRWFSALFALFLSVTGCDSPSTETTDGNPSNTPSDIAMTEFAKRHPDGLQLIDVRTTGEFQGGHIPGALNVPLASLPPGHPVLKSYDTTQPIYIVCQSGGRSARAARALARVGLTVINVKGGTSAWISQGHPVETTASQ